MKAFTTTNFWCLGNRRLLASDEVGTLAKEAVSWLSRMQAVTFNRYLGGEVHCLTRGGRGSYSFETGSAEFC